MKPLFTKENQTCNRVAPLVASNEFTRTSSCPHIRRLQSLMGGIVLRCNLQLTYRVACYGCMFELT